ncbi:MAG TPA: hypothetical protein VG755_34175 [Nannocystaceae bacterium]|nr:hypothetical protein [Nannocystaceae bacterium]
MLLCACHHESPSDEVSSSSETADASGEPTPGAPDEDCPGQLDAARVYLAVRVGYANSTTMLVYPVDEPELACAYRSGQPGQHLFVGAADGGVQFLRYGEAGEIAEYPQWWMEPSSKGGGDVWEVPVIHENVVFVAETLGCPIGSMGSFFVRQRHDGDIGFHCADGIGGTWVYDRPGDETPLEVDEAIGHELVAPLPGDRWLLSTDTMEDVGLRVLQGDGQQIDIAASDGIQHVSVVVARATETGALVVGYVDRGEGSSALELVELVGEQLTAIAPYEHDMQIPFTEYNRDNAGSEPAFRSALGADGTLAAIIDDHTTMAPVRRAVWMRPDTPPVTVAEVSLDQLPDDPARADEIIEVIDVLSQ